MKRICRQLDLVYPWREIIGPEGVVLNEVLFTGLCASLLLQKEVTFLYMPSSCCTSAGD